MSCEPTISVRGLGKCYHIYRAPKDRLMQLLFRGRRTYFREFWALRQVDFQVGHGEVIGIIGRNGSGKSTLLQLVCGTLSPSEGEVRVRGRVAALLELGAGFNPEFTGRENVYMSAAILGLSSREIEERFDAIVDFSEVRDFIDQPVKTYSSGMFMRLAFAVATSVDPDVLVIDEALSVGDGAFAYKSFNRIMQLRNAGKTILFCSHALFQVESLCRRTIWIDHGTVIADGDSADVVAAYQTFLDGSVVSAESAGLSGTGTVTDPPQTPAVSGHARLGQVEVLADGAGFRQNPLVSDLSTIEVSFDFLSDPALPCPTAAVTFHAMDGRMLTSTATWEDGVSLVRDAEGRGSARVVFARIPLLKGSYELSVHLLCENGIHLYDSANAVAVLQVQQRGRTQGYFSIPHHWDAA